MNSVIGYTFVWYATLGVYDFWFLRYDLLNSGMEIEDMESLDGDYLSVMIKETSLSILTLNPNSAMISSLISWLINPLID